MTITCSWVTVVAAATSSEGPSRRSCRRSCSTSPRSVVMILSVLPVVCMQAKQPSARVAGERRSWKGGRCGEMWGEVGRCGEMWGGVGRYGEIWGDLGRCAPAWGGHPSTCASPLSSRRRADSPYLCGGGGGGGG